MRNKKNDNKEAPEWAIKSGINKKEEDHRSTLAMSQEWAIQGESQPNKTRLTRQPSLQTLTRADSKVGAELEDRGSPKNVRQPPSKAQAEKELLSLNIQLTKVKNDILKIENSKVRSSLAIKQRKELETRLESLNRQILPLKTQIRTKNSRGAQ